MRIASTVRFFACTVIGCLAFAVQSVAQPQQQPTTYDCQAIYGKKAKESFTLPAAQIEYCAMRGWDPPGKSESSFPADYNWLPAGGKPVRTGTAGSLQIGAKQPPATPPGSSASSTPAGSSGSITFSVNQPTQSSQCFDLNGQRVCPRCSVQNGRNVCEVPVIDPTTGQITYRPATGNEEERVLQPRNPVVGDIGGQLGPIRLAANGMQLACGGAMNLANIEMSTVKNATHLAIANPHGAYEASSEQQYQCDSTQPPPQMGPDGNPLPPAGGGSYNCQETPEEEGGDDASQVRLVRVYARNGNVFQFLREIRLAKKLDGVDKDNKTRPVRQFIFFNLAQGQVALRAIQPREDAQEQAGEGAVVYNTADEEKYVIVTTASLINGTSRPSKEKFTRYPSTIPDFRIVPPQASEDVTMELPLNVDACKDRVLHLDLTTPNLVFQPGTTVNVATISDRAEKATLTGGTSILYFQPETFLRLGVPGEQFTFRSAAVIELPFRSESDAATLHMYGPTTITGGTTPQFYLGGGGHTEDTEGNILQRFAPSSSFVPPGGLRPPYYVVADEKVYLPTGLTMLNDRGGYVREPSCPAPTAETPCPVLPAGCPAIPSCNTGP